MSERGVWVIRDGELIPKHLAPPLHRKYAESAMVIRDSMDATWNPVNGRHYDSKRAYEKAVRQAGCQIVGNEKVTASARPSLPDPATDIKNAFDRAGAKTNSKKRKRRTRNE